MADPNTSAYNNNNTSQLNSSTSSTKSLASASLTGKSFPFPDCWHDDIRMESLMSAFRERQLNPHVYDTKMQFWTDMIADYCTFKGKAHFCHNELRKSFVRCKHLPNCLSEVLDELRRQKKIRPRNEYQYDPANSWRGWAVNCLLKRPLHWSVQRLKSSVGFDDPKANDYLQYVHVEAMQKFCRDLETLVLQPLQGKIIHYDVFRESLAKTSLELTDECLHMCVHTLNCLGKIGVEYINENNESRVHLIKVPTKKDPSIEITANDHAVHNLQMTHKNLLAQLDTIETDIHANEQKARQFLQQGKRLMAKSYLRRKRTLETKHEKLSLALHNIDELLSNVEEAQRNGDILDAYKIGSMALQNALKQSGLTYDSAHEVIMDAKDTMEQHREMQDLIATSNIMDDTMSSIDDAELEKELRELAGVQTKSADVVGDNAKPNKTIPTPAPAPPIAMPKTVQISDSQLLAMLDALEVEDGTPCKAAATSSMVTP